MQEHKSHQRKVEDILESLEGIQKAAPDPWFYNRIQNRLAATTEKDFWVRTGSFFTKPVVVAFVAVFIVLFNIATFVSAGKDSSDNIVHQEEPLTSESMIASNSSYDFETFMHQ